MFPQIEIENEEIIKDIEQEQEEEQKEKIPKFTFLVDFKEKKFLKENGKIIKTNDTRSVRMWIEKVLITKANKYKIYDEYGMYYYDLIIGQRFPQSFLYAELKREIEEVMVENEQIQEIQNFEAKLVKKKLNVNFDVILKNGEYFNWEAYL